MLCVRCLGETEDSNNKVNTTSTTTTATTHEPISERQTVDKSEQKKKSEELEILKYELNDEDMELVELSASHNLTPNRQTTHRELPVDVPESFVG